MTLKVICLFSSLFSLSFMACREVEKSDAYGNFETIEVIVGAEANGKLVTFDVYEGISLNKGDVVGSIDTTQLTLQKQQVIASIEAIKAQLQDVKSQLDVFHEQKRNIIREKERIKELLSDGAATKKQRDDITGEAEVVEKKIIATKRQLEIANRAIISQIAPLKEQVKSINDRIAKSMLVNPLQGEVLTKFMEENEVVGFGRPLYSIANLDEMILRVYVSGIQLPHIRLGQEVEVLIDETEKDNRALSGRISWISSRAEFTPKIIQTKDERASLVYAVKILVKNDGSLKIGMPGEVNFKSTSTQSKNSSK